ncbi:glutaredoxin family protein [Bacillus kexueae]|uniref:glutaredoxin family protein n=1 Tax=Aeribacillus kexueae TaxID=2078952 RepID=UPI001FB0050D|nr:glutaredoxin family protein [Bacillus kexueae]
MQVVVYSKNGCPLCDEAIEHLKELQNEYPITINVVDIYENDDLLEKYQLMIPVVEIKGEIIGYGKLEKNFLRKRLLEESYVD